MEFTYAAYEHLVVLLKGQGYTFANYKQAGLLPGKVVIMRHDVDFSLPKAVEMARLENRLGIESTYFVLLATDMYNVFSAQSHALLSEITALGHDIGLHFDEVRYQGASLAEIKQHVLNEASILASAMGSEVDAVSMHRPSSAMLESDMQFGALYNSYSRPFFGRAGGGGVQVCI